MWARRTTTRHWGARGDHHERTITRKDARGKLIRKINLGQAARFFRRGDRKLTRITLELLKHFMALDWSQCPAVESVPGKVSGAWVFRGTRMPVATVFENLEAGASIDEIMEWFDLTREQITEVLNFAARSLEVSGSSR